MTTLEHIDEAIGALETRAQWYASRGGRSMRHGKAYKRNRRRALESLAFWRAVRELQLAKESK